MERRAGQQAEHERKASMLAYSLVGWSSVQLWIADGLWHLQGACGTLLASDGANFVPAEALGLGKHLKDHFLSCYADPDGDPDCRLGNDEVCKIDLALPCM